MNEQTKTNPTEQVKVQMPTTVANASLLCRTRMATLTNLKIEFMNGRGPTEDDLYAAADLYLAALRNYKKVKGAKLYIPTRTQVIASI